MMERLGKCQHVMKSLQALQYLSIMSTLSSFPILHCVRNAKRHHSKMRRTREKPFPLMLLKRIQHVWCIGNVWTAINYQRPSQKQKRSKFWSNSPRPKLHVEGIIGNVADVPFSNFFVCARRSSHGCSVIDSTLLVYGGEVTYTCPHSTPKY